MPTKLLVPFLEKASLEDLDKDMQDRWAALLLSASKEYHASHLTFVDILSRLSSSELKLLEEVCFLYKAFQETTQPRGHVEHYRNKLARNAHSLLLKVNEADLEKRHILARQAYDEFVKASVLTYGEIMYAQVPTMEPKSGKSHGAFWFYKEYFGRPWTTSLEILERERLVNIERLKVSDIGTEIGYYNVTYLGVRFVRDCSPQASQIAGRRPKAVPARRS